ncbi:MFS transporter [Pseudomonas oryzihabitans]|uniref:MFS transporter n=1 Tax=Pseudomonas oryzihabitans TaxID=47885 RepID=A0ABX3IT24_9PSED|nr:MULTISPECIES: MFS transporter [Pseudomonas]KIZ51345.1 MFS transporter [Pseudomonas oryzihabitans]ONN71468.1 MFS transporter [Pseudomonas psychrotolerans]
MAHPSTAASPVQFDPLYRKVAWRVLPLLLLGYIIAYLDRVNVGFAKLAMLSDLGMSDAAYGLGAGIFFIGYFLFEVPSNLMLHRVGAKLWIARIMITWGLVSSLMAFTGPIAQWLGISHELTFYGLRFLLGVCEAGFFPGVILYLTYWFPAALHSRMMAIVILGNPVSFIFGGPLSGAIMYYMGSNGLLAGWQWMFVIEAVPAVVVGVVVLWLLDNGIQDARWLNQQEKAELTRRLALEAAEKPRIALKRLYALPIIWLLTVIYVLLMLGNYGINFWVPTIIKNAGVASVLDIGLITAIPYVFGAATMVWVTRQAQRTGNQRAYGALMSVLAGIGLILCAAFPQHLLLMILGVAFAVGGSLSAIALFWGLPGAFLQGAAAAAGIAIINSFGNLGGFAGPYLLGLLTTLFGSAQVGLMLLGGCLLGCAALMLWVTRRPAPSTTGLLAE